MDEIHWHVRWLQMVDLISSWSEDNSTKVGAVIIDARQVLLALGWNGLPRGILAKASRNERPIKYQFYEHAERNAIFNAAAKGIELQGSTLYTQFVPCAECARAIIQSGIKRVIVGKAICNERWIESEKLAIQMFFEAKIQLFDLEGPLLEI